MARHVREFDLILWGATGFTGALVAEHLVERHRGSDLVWAIAGRDEAKLRTLRDDLGAPDVPIVLGDALDPEAMAALARRTRVVCSTVGPYARLGSALVAACAEAGTDYCDLAGEIPWVQRMLLEHDAAARASGARIVPSCGFDCIPSDMGVFFVQREARRRFGAPSPSIVGAVARFDGGISGGTVASALEIAADAVRDRDVRRTLFDRHALTPGGAARPRAAPDIAAPHFSRRFAAWTAPFVGATIDTRVVRRSQALLAASYGPSRYREVAITGAGLGGAVRAYGTTLGLFAGAAALAVGPLRRMIASLLPSPGEGPDASTRARGGWELRFVAEAPSGSGAQPLEVRMRGDRDPGYGSTARMLGEAASCLALDDLPVSGGFHTPASALGSSLLDRLVTHAGVSFEVV